MRCEECRAVPGEAAEGWRALRVDDLAEEEEPELAFFCPRCAEREFGPRTPKRDGTSS